MELLKFQPANSVAVGTEIMSKIDRRKTNTSGKRIFRSMVCCVSGAGSVVSGVSGVVSGMCFVSGLGRWCVSCQAWVGGVPLDSFTVERGLYIIYGLQDWSGLQAGREIYIQSLRLGLQEISVGQKETKASGVTQEPTCRLNPFHPP